jgi:aminoglycoside phosphotransferase (APT) family kinase protein
MSGAFSIGQLERYLQKQGLSASNLTVAPLSGGQSNPTFLLRSGDTRYVLRKQPPGNHLPGAHAVDREYRVMRALQGSPVPVPKMLAYCEDASVVGSPFVLMEYLDGRVLVDQALPGMAPGERGDIYRDMNKVIAALHAVDYKSIGLETFGKAGNYFMRQISRWSRQCQASTLPLSTEMQQLMEWLPEHIPPGDETTLVHGDYRLDNLVLHPSEPRIIGVLDWELSTLGHPLADFSYQCMGWHIPPALWRGIGGLDLPALGIPSEQEYIQLYVQATGREVAEHWEFYIAYNLFRMSAILHGIAQRAIDGNAAADDAVQTGAKAGPLAKLGWQSAMRYAANRT